MLIGVNGFYSARCGDIDLRELMLLLTVEVKIYLKKDSVDVKIYVKKDSEEEF